MSKKASKSASRSFLKEPSLQVLEAAFQETATALKEVPLVLKDQEANVTAHQATQIAKIEMEAANQGIKDLVAIAQQRLGLLNAKLESIDKKKKAAEESVGRADEGRQRLQNLREMRLKIGRGNLDFLKPPTTDRAQSSTTLAATAQSSSSTETVVEAKESISQATVVSVASTVRTAPLIVPFSQGRLERPTLTSDIGLRTTAERQAQQAQLSARKLQRSVHGTGHFLTPIDEGLNQGVNSSAALSGGSNLDGSFYDNGVTYEQIMGAARLSPTIGDRAFPQPNFDETELEIENNIPAVDATDDAIFPPPFQLNNRITSLGLLPKASIEPVPRMSNIFPVRPVLSSSIGQQLNKK